MYVNLSEEIIMHLPHSLRPENNEAVRGLIPQHMTRQRDYSGRKPAYLWKMMRCQYGHPRSAALFIESWIEQMKACEWHQNVADCAILFRDSDKEEEVQDVFAAYVDDAIATCKEKEDGAEENIKETPWEQLRRRFTFEDPHVLDVYLGVFCRQYETENRRVCELDMEPYCKLIIAEFDRTTGDQFQWQADVPILQDIYRPSNEPTGPLDPAYYSQAKIKAATQIMRMLTLHDVQSLVGMLLWLCRCARFDIGYAVSSLASCIHKWSETASAELLQVISYLRKHRHEVLRMVYDKRDNVRGITGCYGQ